MRHISGHTIDGGLTDPVGDICSIAFPRGGREMHN